MREIKFRAWDGDTMQYDVLAGFHGKDHLNQDNVCDVDETGEEVWFWHEPPIAIMQFTGLKDKNGKEIYEGDIVVNYEGKNPCVVKWGGASVDIKGCGHDEDWSTLEGGWSAWEKPLECYQREVVGNIYENPELLKSRTEPKGE